MAYVPPSRRNLNAGQAAATGRFYSLEEIQSFIGTRANTLTPHPDTGDLCAITLYQDQHPDWTSARQIFCKSNLEVLRDGAVTEGQSFPVFIGLPFGRRFEFAGHYKAKNIQWLQPNSQELVKYLERKFNPPTTPGRKHAAGSEGRTRTETAWSDALSREWAVVTLEKDDTKINAPF